MARITRSALLATIALAAGLLAFPPSSSALDPSPPVSTVKLVFIHHSTGGAWLGASEGLASRLMANDYFVSDTNYGWGPDGIGDHTDVGDWWTWFRGPSAATYTSALYGEYDQNAGYSRLPSDPGGTNEIVMFKSCFPNSAVGGSPADVVPSIGSNPLKGAGMSNLTVGNAKGIYLDFLEYAKLHPEKLFVLVITPPLRPADTNATSAANARHLANWLVDPGGWLKDYAPVNVVAFDYYTVLTAGHHRVVGATIEHTAGPSDYLAYPTGDSHPSDAGHNRAAAEFAPWLNAAYHAWKAGEKLPPPGTPDAVATSITIKTSATTARTGSIPILSGSVTPTGTIGENIVVYVMKPGKTYWTYSSNRTVYGRYGAAAWLYKYTFKRGMTKGLYRFKSVMPAAAGFRASTSAATVGIRLR